MAPISNSSSTSASPLPPYASLLQRRASFLLPGQPNTLASFCNGNVISRYHKANRGEDATSTLMHMLEATAEKNRILEGGLQNRFIYQIELNGKVKGFLIGLLNLPCNERMAHDPVITTLAQRCNYLFMPLSQCLDRKPKKETEYYMGETLRQIAKASGIHLVPLIDCSAPHFDREMMIQNELTNATTNISNSRSNHHTEALNAAQNTPILYRTIEESLQEHITLIPWYDSLPQNEKNLVITEFFQEGNAKRMYDYTIGHLPSNIRTLFIDRYNREWAESLRQHLSGSSPPQHISAIALNVVNLLGNPDSFGIIAILRRAGFTVTRINELADEPASQAGAAAGPPAETAATTTNAATPSLPGDAA